MNVNAKCLINGLIYFDICSFDGKLNTATDIIGNNDSNDNIAGDNIESNSISNQEMISEQEDKHNRNVESQEQG